ncbi:helix-turn-helix domain-containing protein [Sphingomonas xinjiangensis]|uniref:DNA-binding CsgD family transcriptional regulator n=1 Tax=Sphingomonas xinjiangensis TaxID=643568 RepID=A0A840YCD0_9SPHN|nr:DUF4019 domain-containing protein [Sphingomonas xinjiangensis]MBB5710504.1 DNA-binding CsgD family transcriptional regulator [Sphingomonas xinjiangensis]
MNDGVAALSAREKEALRLLLAGHDAKSASAALGLSVHTVNERLRDARKKLGVSSSREAARLLGEQEQAAPNSHGYEDLGVVHAASEDREDGRPGRRRTRDAVAWLSGGMLIMSLIIAGIALTALLHPGSGIRAVAPPPAASQAVAETEGVKAARAWIRLVDDQRWAESWRQAGQLFTSQLTEAGWVAAVRPVREPLGAVSSRALQTVTNTSKLPGVADGSYQVIEFRTSFAARPNAVETVTVAREGAAWKVVGYFIR